jgi:hypothetical protein
MTCSLRVSSDVFACIAAPLSKAVFACQSAAAFHRLICGLTRPGPTSEILPKPNSDGWECRDLLGAGRAGYRQGVVALNVGLRTAGKRNHIPSCNGWGDRDASAQLG